MYEVEVVEERERRVLGVPHHGPYHEIGPAFERLSGIIAEAGLLPEVDEHLGVYFDDPGEVAQPDLRSLAAVTVGAGVTAPAGLEETRVPSGRYARMVVAGPYSGLPDAYGWLCGQWLPDRGEQAAESPSFEVYLNDPSRVPEEELRTLVYLPLA